MNSIFAMIRKGFEEMDLVYEGKKRERLRTCDALAMKVASRRERISLSPIWGRYTSSSLGGKFGQPECNWIYIFAHHLHVPYAQILAGKAVL